MTDFTDDFNISSDDLGANWTQAYAGGSGQWGIETDNRRASWVNGPITFEQTIEGRLSEDISDVPLDCYGRLPSIDGEQSGVGARLSAGDLCERCRKPIGAGHVFIADLKPQMSGTFRHRDCDDPTLAKVVDE
jgi:hypothetical protein